MIPFIYIKIIFCKHGTLYQIPNLDNGICTKVAQKLRAAIGLMYNTRHELPAPLYPCRNLPTSIGNVNIPMKELLRTALPLMAAALVATINQFVDRLFLGHVSDVAREAITPVTVLTTVFSCTFLEIAGYTGTFVAQYSGRHRHNQAVRALAQGFWLSVAVPRRSTAKRSSQRDGRFF